MHGTKSPANSAIPPFNYLFWHNITTYFQLLYSSSLSHRDALSLNIWVVQFEHKIENHSVTWNDFLTIYWSILLLQKVFHFIHFFSCSSKGEFQGKHFREVHTNILNSCPRKWHKPRFKSQCLCLWSVWLYKASLSSYVHKPFTQSYYPGVQNDVTLYYPNYYLSNPTL